MNPKVSNVESAPAVAVKRGVSRQLRHPYCCPVCFDGRVEKELWEMLYGKNLGLQTCGQSPKHLTPLKIWIGQQLDEIDSHGCQSCWSDSHSGCTCKPERETMKQTFIAELTRRMGEVA